MANQGQKQIDHPPIDIPLVKEGQMHPVWLNWFNSLKPTLEATTTNLRLQVPGITTVERDKIPNVTNGMQVYNTDTHKMQVYENGQWKTVTTGS